MLWRTVHIISTKIIRIAKKRDIQVIKRHRDEKNQKSFKKHFTNVRILGIIDRQSGRRAETEH